MWNKNTILPTLTGAGSVLVLVILKGEGSFIGNLVAVLLGSVVGLIISKALFRKSKPVDMQDERLKAKRRKFLDYLLLISFGFFGLNLMVLFVLGYETIRIDYISGFLLFVLFAFLMGSDIINKKLS